MSDAEYETRCLPTPAAFAAYAVSLLLLLALFIYRHILLGTKPQEGREKKRRCRGKKGNARGFVLLEPLQPSETSTHSPICPEWDATYEAVCQLERAFEVLDRLSYETPEDSDDSWTTITASTLGTSPQESLISLVDEANLQIQQSAPESKLPANANGLPFLDEAVRSELEHHIEKLKIQRRYGLHQRILDCEKSFENVILR